MSGQGRGEDESGDLPVDSSLLDPVTQLYAEPFFLATTSWRLGACRRVLRPLAVTLFEVVDGLPKGPVLPSEPKVVAAMLRQTLRASDVGARLYDGTYGLLLEDTPEDGAVWAVERVRRALDAKPGTRVLRAGIACYPGQALTAVEMLDAAHRALAAARQWPQDRIEVALAEP
jgi:hypothetical protein